MRQTNLSAQQYAGNAGAYPNEGSSRPILLVLSCGLILGFASVLGYDISNNPSEKKVEKTQKQLLDLYGDPLPRGAVARMGSMRLRNASIQSVSFSRDGKQLISISSYGSIWFWDVPSGKFLRSISGYGISPDGKTIFTHVDERNKKIPVMINAKTGKEQCRFTGEITPTRWHVFSPDGNFIASTHGRNLCWWDTHTGRLLHRVEVVLINRGSIAVSPDSKQIAHAVSRTSGDIILRDIASGKALRRLIGHKEMIRTLAFSPDGKTLASTGSDGILRIWDLRSGEELRRSKVMVHPLCSVTFAEEGKAVVTSGNDGVIRVWDSATAREKRTISESPGSQIQMTSSPDGSLAACWSEDSIRLWNLNSGKRLFAPAGHRGNVTGLAFVSQGKVLATRALDGAVRLWEAATGKELSLLEIGESNRDSVSVAASANGKILVTGSNDGILTVWDVPTAKSKLRFRGNLSGGSRIAISPDGKLVASGGANHTIHLLRTADGKETHRFKIAQGGVTSLAFSSDSRRLAAGGYHGAVTVWDLKSREEVVTFDGHSKQVIALAFSPDCRMLAACGIQDPSVSLHEMATGAKRGEWKIVQAIRPPLFGYVAHIAFSERGNLLAAAGQDRFYLWDVQAEKELWRSPRHDGQVAHVAFNSDSLLASGNATGVSLIWDLNTIIPARSDTKELPTETLKSLWRDLGSSDTILAYQAVRRLWASPKKAVEFLGKQLHPIRISKEILMRIDSSIEDLNSNIYRKRQQASETLLTFGPVAIPAIKKAFRNTDSPEVRRRARDLLSNLPTRIPDAATLQSIRAVEALEHIGTPEAIVVLRRLAEGAEGFPQTIESVAALRRFQLSE